MLIHKGGICVSRVKCPIDGEEMYEENLPLHAKMAHIRYDDRVRIYEFLIDRQLRMKYAIHEKRKRNDVEYARPQELLACLRGGVPPRFGIGAITAGRDEEIALVERLLDSRQSSSRHMILFNGGNGSGKSHILTCARDKALMADFMVLKVDIAGNSCTLSELNRMAMSMLENGLCPDIILSQSDPTSFDRSLLNRLEQVALEEYRMEDHGTPSPKVLVWRMKQVLLQAGRRGALPLLSRIQTHLSLMDIEEGDLCEMLPFSLSDFVVYMGKLGTRLGYSGCVFILDELEEDRCTSSYDVLKTLAECCNPTAILLMAATPDLLWNRYDGIKTLKPNLGSLLEDHLVEIKPLSQLEMEELARNVALIFSAIHPEIGLDYGKLRGICVRVLDEGGGPRALIDEVLECLEDKCASLAGS